MLPFSIVERIDEEEIHERADIQMECSEVAIRNERIQFTNSWRIKIALESYFEKRAQEIWERNSRKDHVVEYVQSKIDGNDSEDASWTI